MVIVEHKWINNIPLLHVVKGKLHQEKLPFVIFIHGITSAKEHNLHYAYLLAEKGIRVILPEAMHHGEREEGGSQKKLYADFWKIVLTAIHEINGLREYYVNENLADPERIGVAGTSMGGIVTLGALTQYSWIKTAVSLMGMPSYEQFSLWQLDRLKAQGIHFPLNDEEISEQLKTLRKYDLSLQPEKLDNRPLLFWHAKNDPVIPYPLTYRFFELIRDDYRKSPERLKFISDEHAGHKVSREGLKAMVHWFDKYL